MNQIDLVRQTVVEFCVELTRAPYLCCTEHGQHALFHTMLYNALPEEQRFATWYGNKVCVIQKEYSTAGNLGKSRRQHWDIAVINTPPDSIEGKPQAYDYLKLAAVVEFGMNEAKKHLVDDIERLSHREANVMQGFVVHLYRLSEPGAPFSRRDWSANSKRILTPEEVGQLAQLARAEDEPVEIYYAMHDSTGKHSSGVWSIKQGVIAQVCGG